jgi:uncharacterized protein
MKAYTQHGTVSTYDHCLSVAGLSYRLSRRLHIRVDERCLIAGAFLHDFYLYDWHVPSDENPGLHGFTHPAVAADIARRYFRANARTCGVIASHMWPLTLTHMPRCRESVIVSLADKYCASREFILAFRRRARQFLTDRRR